MTSRALMAKRNPERVDRWTGTILAEKPFRLATTAMANKTARIAWALLTKRQDYRQPAVYAPPCQEMQDAEVMMRSSQPRARTLRECQRPPEVAKPFGTSLAELIRAGGGIAATQTGRTHDCTDEMRNQS